LLETLDLDPKKVHVVHNGVNPNLVSIGESSAVNSPYPLVLTACRLMPHKGIDKVLHAISFLRQEFPNIQYRIVGQGPDRERLDRIVSDLKIEAHVEFLGPVSQETLDQEYRNAHLFTMLSRQQDHHVEGFGLVFLEAALRKTASLGGDSGGVPDAIADGQTGWLVDPLDQEKINQKFLEILSDREDLEKIALKAESLTRKERTWNSSVEKMIEAMT
ncbi:MAG: glycosyltransferase family 4 protein, partial [Pseudomonadota bacterium]